MISIIMAAYNAENTIKSSIESVISQTYEDWELIIVDDCSKDSTQEIVKAYAEKDMRIHLYANERNIGASSTRNNGIARAVGEWIAILDSDDIWHMEKLEIQVSFMESIGAVISYTGTTYISKEGTTSDYVLRAKQRLTYSELLRRNLMSCSSVMVRRDVMKPFPVGNMHEDYAVWLKILKEHDFAHGLDEPLLIYRMAGDSKSGKRLASAKMIYNTYRHVGYNWFWAALLTLRYSIHSISKRAMIKRMFKSG